MTLYRGNHKLPHQSQATGRDLCAEEIARRWCGKDAHAYMLTDEQLQDRIDGKPGTGLPYRFLIHSPDSAALAWTAFFTREALQNWLDAYGLTLDREPSPGESFRVSIPTVPTLAELCDDGTAHDAGKPDPDHAALYLRRLIHYRETFGNGYVPAVCGVRGGRIVDGEARKVDVTCPACRIAMEK